MSYLQGTLSSRGRNILMADADGATKFSDLDKVEAGLKDVNTNPVRLCFCCYLPSLITINFSMPVFSHSGQHGHFLWFQSSPGKRICRSGNFLFHFLQRIQVNLFLLTKLLFLCFFLQRSVFRTFLMLGFHFLVWFFCVRGIKDTQCGFKLFTREAALRTFPSLHVERW